MDIESTVRLSQEFLFLQFTYIVQKWYLADRCQLHVELFIAYSKISKGLTMAIQ